MPRSGSLTFATSNVRSVPHGGSFAPRKLFVVGVDWIGEPDAHGWMHTPLPIPRASQTTVKSAGRWLLIFFTMMMLAACEKKGAMDGTYSSSVQSYTFKGDTVAVSLMGKPMADKWTYSVDGKKVIVKGPGGDLVLMKNDDGSLSDPANDKLVKK